MTLKLRLTPGRQKSKGKGRDKLVVFEVTGRKAGGAGGIGERVVGDEVKKAGRGHGKKRGFGVTINAAIGRV